MDLSWARYPRWPMNPGLFCSVSVLYKSSCSEDRWYLGKGSQDLTEHGQTIPVGSFSTISELLALFHHGVSNDFGSNATASTGQRMWC
jgi:hypothetical protein